MVKIKEKYAVKIMGHGHAECIEYMLLLNVVLILVFLTLAPQSARLNS